MNYEDNPCIIFKYQTELLCNLINNHLVGWEETNNILAIALHFRKECLEITF